MIRCLVYEYLLVRNVKKEDNWDKNMLLKNCSVVFLLNVNSLEHIRIVSAKFIFRMLHKDLNLIGLEVLLKIEELLGMYK